MSENGNVDFSKVESKWKELSLFKVSLASKYWNEEVCRKAKNLPPGDQHRILDMMMGGLCNDDSSVGVYATRPDDYDLFSFYL